MNRSHELESRESGSRERLAWLVLILVFAIWVGIVISVPLLVNQLLQTSTRPLTIEVQANTGAVRLNTATTAGAMFTGEPPVEVEAPLSIATDAGDTSALQIYSPEGQLVGRVEINAGTTLDVVQAVTPRFDISSQDSHLSLDLQRGRLRLKLPPAEERPFTVSIETPLGMVHLLGEGHYAVESSNGMAEVVVIEGAAQMVTPSSELSLQPGERGTIEEEGEVAGPLDTERSLIRNGDFQEGLTGWDQLSWNIELGEQPAGTTEVVDIDGVSTLRFSRVGEGHADSGIRQIINQDVSDFQSIRLELSLAIQNHTVAVCGSLGSECPITLRVQYEDINGNDQVWQQGFFAIGDALSAGVPDVCVSCAPPRPEHERITAGQSAFYRVELLDLLPQFGMVLPAKIKSISILSAGHSFDVNVFDVNLFVQE